MPDGAAPLSRIHEDPARLAALARTGIMDTTPEPAFDDLADLAARACGTALSAVCFIDARRQWFKAGRGFLARETPLDRSVSLHALDHPGPFVVPDLALDPRTSADPVTAGGAPLRFYAGVRLVTADGHALGTVCVADEAPRPAGLTAGQAASLEALARQAMVLVDARRTAAEHEAGRRPVAAAEALGHLAMNMAHDVNNLLTVVKGAAERLGRPGLAPARRDRHLQAIRDAADGAAALTAGVLAFARAHPAGTAMFDAGRRLAALRDALGLLSGGRVAVTLRLPAQPCLVAADPGQFDAALVNLAVNARDAMAGEGRLMVSVRSTPCRPATATAPAAEGPHVAVSFADTGCGVPPEHLGRLFEPFFTTKAPGCGTGLGLAQVCGFAAGAGGAVGVASEVGRGSTFTLYLPAAADRRAPPDNADRS